MTKDDDAALGPKTAQQKVEDVLDQIQGVHEATQKEANTLLVAHLARKPHALLIVSVSDNGAFLSHCQGFSDPGQVLIARELAHQMGTDACAKIIAQSRAAAALAGAQNPPAPTPENPT